MKIHDWSVTSASITSIITSSILYDQIQYFVRFTTDRRSGRQPNICRMKTIKQSCYQERQKSTWKYVVYYLIFLVCVSVCVHVFVTVQCCFRDLFMFSTTTNLSRWYKVIWHLLLSLLFCNFFFFASSCAQTKTDSSRKTCIIYSSNTDRVL